MIPISQQASHLLVGKVLEGGWRVVRKITPDDLTFGITYSCCYEVECDSRKGFLKAFDYSAASKVGVEDPEKEILSLLSAYNNEKSILEMCSSHSIKNVIELYDSGSIEVLEAGPYPRVVYLITEYASNGDLTHCFNNGSKSLLWKLQSLHQLTNGIRRLHSLKYVHQDLSPKNVVDFGNNITKIVDFGTAMHIDQNTTLLPYRFQKEIVGAWEYAPPELLYGLKIDDTVRRVSCDLYLLGSMVAYYFTNVNMTALLRHNLHEELSWTNQRNYGKFNEITPHLTKAFGLALDDLGSSINDLFIREKILEIVKYLCNPDPFLRGHKKTIFQRGSNFDLYRFVTMFDRMVQYIKIKS